MPRPPIAWIAVAFGAGLWAGLFFWGEGGSGKGEGVVLGLLVASALPLARAAPLGAALGLMAVAGALWGGAAVRERAATCAGRWSGNPARTHAAIVRLIDPVPADGGITDGDVVAGAPCGGSLHLRWPDGAAASGGSAWVVAGRYVGDPARGIFVARRVRLLDPRRTGRGGIRDRVIARVDALFGGRATMVEALVLARRAELDPAIRERYAQAGLAHLLAISGLHVGFLAGWIGIILGWVRVPYARRLWLTALAVGGYVWLLGFPAPATRAAVMFLLRAAASWRDRRVAPRGLLGVTALLLFAVDPWALQSVGAWLSLAAVAAVLWAGRVAERLPRFARALAPTCAATLFTAPITAFAFGTVAPIGVIANLIAIPLAAVAVPGLMLALGASVIAPGLGVLFAAGSGACLAALDQVARAAAAVPGGHVVMMAGWFAAAAWCGIAFVAWWLWNSPRRPWLIAGRVALVLAAAVALSFRSVVSLDECRCLTIFFLDVGQGDAALLRTPAGHWMAIDGGPRTPEGDAGRRVVVPFLRRVGAADLALVVATHGDADHLGGLPALVSAFPPRLVLEPGEPLGRPLYLEFLAAVEASGARYRPARSGDRITLDSVTLEVLSPDSVWLALPLDVNDHGVVLRVTYGAVRLLFQADAGLPVEERLAGRIGPVDVLKVGHHGSRSATSDAWVGELAPHAAVISVGRHNRYGHPAPEVVARLAAHGVRILRTDRDGTITLSTDGQRAHIQIRSHQ